MTNVAKVFWSTRTRYGLAALLALGLLALAAACGGEEEGPAPAGTPSPQARQLKTDVGVTDTEIRIGHTGVFSGPYAILRPYSDGLKAYVDYVNRERGGVCNRTIRLITEDSQYSTTVARQAAVKLVEQDRVLALVGDIGTEAVLGEAPYAAENKVPHLFVGTGAAELADGAKYPWTILGGPDWVAEGQLLGEYANDRFPNARVGILYQNDVLGQSFVDGFRRTFRGSIVAMQPHEPTATDITSQMANLRAANIDLLFLATAAAFSPRAFAYMGSVGWRPQVMMPTPNYPVIIANIIGGGDPARGLQVVRGTIQTQYFKDVFSGANDPAVQEHARIMRTYANADPNPLTLQGQIAGELMVETLKRACDAGDLTRQGVMNMALSLRGFQPTVWVPGITTNFSPQFRMATRCLLIVEIQADGSPRPLINQPRCAS
jgi:ABC-type branched-subunit amino acid transport system substrate-binding protein